MATVDISRRTRSMMEQGKNTLRDHRAKYGPFEEKFFSEAGVSDRERTLADAVSRGTSVNTTLNALRNVDSRQYGTPIGGGANTHRRSAAANQASGALSMQAAREKSDFDQQDTAEKIAALQYGQGQTTAISGKNNLAEGQLQRTQILGKQIRDAQRERNQGAYYDLAGSALAEAGRLAYDSEVTGDGGGLGGWLADHGFKRPGTDRAADLYDAVGGPNGLTNEQRAVLFQPTSLTNRMFGR